MSGKTHWLAKKKQSNVIAWPLRDQKTTQALGYLKNLFTSCYGPWGELKAVHNNSGGHVTVTSCSQRLLSNISLKNSILSLLSSALHSQNRNCSDGGLLTGMFILNLLETFSQSEYHPHLISEILELLQFHISSYMSGDECKFKVKLDFTSMNDMLTVAKTLIGSKPLCGLGEKDLEFTAKLVVETFLSSFNDGKSGNVQYVTVEGLPVTDSELLEGILFEVPQIATYLTKGNPIHDIKKLNLSLENNDQKLISCIKVFSVGISLSGDSDSFLDDVTYEITTDITLADAIVKKIMVLAKFCVDENVGLLACQKVVHPRVKAFLSENNILVLDRLGSPYMDPFCQLSGSQSYTSLSVPSDVSCFGYLSNVKHCIYNARSYLHLQGFQPDDFTLITNHFIMEKKTFINNADTSKFSVRETLADCVQMEAASAMINPQETTDHNNPHHSSQTPTNQPECTDDPEHTHTHHHHHTSSPVLTVVVCNRNEESVSELKAVLRSAVGVLGECARAPWGLPGGGCWQALLARHINGLMLQQVR